MSIKIEKSGVMSKQIVMVVMSAVMFITVWAIVIFQFNAKTSEPIELKEPLDLAVMDSETTSDRVIPLPESITDESLSLVEESIDPSLEVIEEGSSEEFVQENQGLVTESGVLIDLRLYDFSDISTADGIPIEGILSKLNLE